MHVSINAEVACQQPTRGAEGAAADVVKLRSVGTRYVTLQEDYERTETPQQWGYLLDYVPTVLLVTYVL